MKTALHVGGYWDLNVYTADLGGGLLGWATFPEKKVQREDARTWTAWSSTTSRYPAEMQTSVSDAVYNEGDTLTHEAGHWLSLYHTFQGGCSKKNDRVDDTPARGSIRTSSATSWTVARTMHSGRRSDPQLHGLRRRPLPRLSSPRGRRRGCRRTGMRCGTSLPHVKNFTPEQGQRRNERDDQAARR